MRKDYFDTIKSIVTNYEEFKRISVPLKWAETETAYCDASQYFREVYLYTVPKTHIRDLRIQTLLDDDYKDATLVIDMDVVGSGLVQMTLSDDDTDILNKINKIAKDLNINLSVENKDKTLKELGLDSLAVIGVIVKLENELKIHVSDEVLSGIKTLEQLVAAIENAVKNK